MVKKKIINKLYGPAIALSKIGPKLLSVGSKLTKSAKVVKFASAGATVASYTWLFTWQFALVIMLLLVIHEGGHIWAMRRSGMKTKGIYFIPFMGGAAVADELFPSRRTESFVAIMGPVFGLALCGLFAGLYFYTLHPFFAAIAAWMALVNLFNLLPVNPLDGGRIIKSFTFSINRQLGLITLTVGMILAAVIMAYTGIWIFTLLLAVGALEAWFEWKGREFFSKNIPKMKFKEMLYYTFSYAWVVVALLIVMLSMNSVPDAGAAMEVLIGF